MKPQPIVISTTPRIFISLVTNMRPSKVVIGTKNPKPLKICLTLNLANLSFSFGSEVVLFLSDKTLMRRSDINPDNTRNNQNNA